MIIITTTSSKIQKFIQQFKEGYGSSHHPHKELFVKTNLGDKNKKSSLFILKDNGMAWCYACSLKKKYSDKVTVYYARDLWNAEMPKLFQEGGEWLASGPRNIQHLPKALGLTAEELESVKLEDVKTFVKLKGNPKNQSTVDKIKLKFK